MTSKEFEKMFLDLNSVLVKFWKEQGRPNKEIKIELLERMLNWYKKMGYCTLDAQSASGSSEIPNDLEEAAEEYEKRVIEETKCHHNALTYAKGFEDTLLLIPGAFIDGAKWQKEKEKEYSSWLAIPELKKAAIEFGEQAKDYEIGGQSFSEDMMVAFTRGAEWQKEQMMKKAMEITLDFTHQITLPFDGPGFGKKGDKVRVIIVKKENE